MDIWDSIISNKEAFIKLLQFLFVLVLARCCLKLLKLSLGKLAVIIRDQRHIATPPASSSPITNNESIPGEDVDTEINNELFQELEMYLSQLESISPSSSSSSSNEQASKHVSCCSQ